MQLVSYSFAIYLVLFGLGHALQIIRETEELLEGIAAVAVGLDELGDHSIVIGMLFVEYFVEAVLVDGLPSMQLESVLILGVWGLLNLFPDFMQFLQGPVLLSVQDDVHSASAHQLL